MLRAFFKVQGFAGGEAAVLGMVENEVLNAEGLRGPAGVLHRGMVLFVGAEDVGFAGEAEGLVQQPCAALGVGLEGGVIGFVAAADEAAPVFKAGCKAKLFYLG